ncbi:MAG: PBP1A family penicillin-binding protein [Alphaproteobacteria bacterium]|nr:PBP1A family penicillin-binding protein [Alphaproteobacteria bacterium]
MAKAELRADPNVRWRTAPTAKPAKRRSARAAAKGARRPWRRILGFLVRWFLVAVIWLAIAVLAYAGYLAYDLPDVSRLGEPVRSPSIQITTADGAVISRIGATYGPRLDYEAISPWLVKAVVATEDRRFFEHDGIDPRGLGRALVANLRAGHVVQGGSTVTQQLAKNLFLTPERTFSRKFKELILAFWLESQFDKPGLMAIYLNRVYFGGGAYGVEAAARRFFSKSAADLTLPEAAMLAGLLKAPSRYAPTHDLDAARARAALVLDNMATIGLIAAADLAAAKASPADLRAPPSTGEGGRYFADWVMEDLGGFVGPNPVDLTVVTTLDARVQRLAEEAIAAELAAHGDAQRVGQIAAVVMAPDGAVLAMVGGRDYGESQFNRATQALRQPGSAFKLFVFLAGLEAGLRPESRFVDGPLSINGFAPRNYDDKYLGEVSLAEALARSLNSVAAQVAWKVGVDEVIGVARRLGVTAPLRRDLSLSLGASEVTLMELTAAYGALANGGRAVLPYGIAQVQDTNGRVLYRRAGSGGSEVIDPQTRARMIRMLADVIAGGTGTAARIDWPVAGKTGTSEGYRDAWFVGFTRGLVAGVWVGNDDNSPMKAVTGGGIPARVWSGMMAGAMAGRPPEPLFEEDFPSLLDEFIAELGLGEETFAAVPAAKKRDR